MKRARKRPDHCHIANNGCLDPSGYRTGGGVCGPNGRAKTTWECPRCNETTCSSCRRKVDDQTLCDNCADEVESEKLDNAKAIAVEPLPASVWISVNDSLPPVRQWVWAYAPAHRTFRAVRDTDNRSKSATPRWFVHGAGGSARETITHWMPEPTAPDA